MRKDIKKYLTDKGFVVADYCCYNRFRYSQLKTGDMLVWRGFSGGLTDSFNKAKCLMDAITLQSMIQDSFEVVKEEVPKTERVMKLVGCSSVLVNYSHPHFRSFVRVGNVLTKLLSYIMPYGGKVIREGHLEYDKVFSFNEDSFERLIASLDFTQYPNLIFTLNINEYDVIAFWKNK
jgi:hypothetical protein